MPAWARILFELRAQAALCRLTPDFAARLKEPEERSFFEKEALARCTAPNTKEGSVDKDSVEKASDAFPCVPERIMVKLVQDEDFRKLMKKNPAKAHELATEAALKGQDRIGEVLRPIRERPKRGRTPWPPATSPVEIAVGVAFTENLLRALYLYKEEQKHPDLPAAACSILLDWFKQQTRVDYVNLQAALRGIIVKSLENRGYYARAKQEVKA